MLNIEKYLDEIVKIIDLNDYDVAVVNDRPVPCEGVKCEECELRDGKTACEAVLIKWLAKEYEEPKVSIPPGTPIDAKVLVSTDGEIWHRRHYAGMENEKHLAWEYGVTSWSCKNSDQKADWEYMKLAEEE